MKQTAVAASPSTSYFLWILHSVLCMFNQSSNPLPLNFFVFQLLNGRYLHIRVCT